MFGSDFGQEMEMLAEMADQHDRLRLAQGQDFPPFMLYREAAASCRLDGETHAIGPVTVEKESDVGYYEANGDDPGILEEAAGFLLSRAAGLDIKSPHGAATPDRFVRMLKELTTPEEFTFTTFPATSMNMVMLKDIPFASVCSHHVIPFVGMAHIAYVPDQLLVGLSKFARLVKYHSHRLQVQETLTEEIAADLEERLKPRGVAVIMEAEHLCMTIRGVQSPGTKTRTAEMRGVFADHDKTAKAEFLSYVNGGHK